MRERDLISTGRFDISFAGVGMRIGFNANVCTDAMSELYELPPPETILPPTALSVPFPVQRL